MRDFVLLIIADSSPPTWVSAEHVKHTKFVVLLFPGLTSTVFSLPQFTTSSTKNSRPPIYQYLTSSIHACPTGTPGNATSMHYVLNTVFQTSVSREEKRDACRIAFLVRVFLVVFITTIVYLYCSRAHAGQKLCAVPLDRRAHRQECVSCRRISKPEGWMETPQVSAEAADPQKDYAIDREMEHSVNALK